MDGFDSDDEDPPILVNLEEVPKTATAASEGLKDTIAASNEGGDDGVLPPCPVTILSGFLGSGKTTLIQYILKSPNHGKRIAVIENEFAQGGDGLSIESLIARDGVSNASLADLIELPNGCMCCTVKDSLVATLEVLLEKRRNLDYILIECSGMANPGPIASVFWLDDALQSRLRLDGIVTLCDAVNLPRQLQETVEAAQQIAHADRILLNKIDLVPSTHHLDALEKKIKKFHPTAPIRRTRHAAVPDLEWILDAACFDGSKFYEKDVLDETHGDEAHNHSHDHGNHGGNAEKDEEYTACTICNHLQHEHTREISTVSLVYRGKSVYRPLLDRWLASILWPNQDEHDKVLRHRLEQEQQQGVGNDFEPRNNDSVSTSSPMSSSNQQSIFRVKGIVSICHDSVDSLDYDTQFIEDHDETRADRRRFIVQGVHDLWEIRPSSEEWQPGEERCCKLVIIGRFLNRTELAAGLEGCLI